MRDNPVAVATAAVGAQDPTPMTREEISNAIQQHVIRAMNRDAGDLTDDRQYIFNRYYGHLYGTEREGYSKFRTREVLEAVEWIMPTLVRAFLGSSRAVVFEANSAEDERQAEQETDVVNYSVMRANGGDGFEAIHNFIKDAVMFPTAYAKVYLEEETETTIEYVGGVLAMDLPALLADPEIEILEQSSEYLPIPVDGPDQQSIPPPQPPDVPAPGMGGAGQPPEGGAPPPGAEAQPPGPEAQPPAPDPAALAAMRMPAPPGLVPEAPAPLTLEVFNLKYRRTRTVPRLKIECVPGEEVLVDRRLTSVNLDHGEFICHRQAVMVADLVEKGYDRDTILSAGVIGDAESDRFLTELINRMFREDESPDEVMFEDSPAVQRVWVYECYVRLDVAGDGTAPLHRVIMVGDTVLEVEETDFQPLIGMSSLLIPHKHTGMSVAEMVMDIQRLMTVMFRQLLDNVYKQNIRKKYISQDSLLDSGATVDNILNTQSEYVVVRGPAQHAIMQEQHESMLQHMLPLIQHVQQSTSMRTGISPETAVDPATLQQSTFGAFAAALDKASERSELITRCMAETGIKQLFRKVHTLHRKHPDITTTVKLRGEWLPVDTRTWGSRENVRTNVGLGHHSRQAMVALMSSFLDKQLALLPAGLTDLRRVHNALDKYVEALGLGEVGTYFIDPADDNAKSTAIMPPPPPPDPQAALAEAQAQALQAEAERKGQEVQAKVELDRARLEQDGQVKSRELDNQAREISVRERDTALREAMQPLEMAKVRAQTADAEAGAALKTEQRKAVETGAVRDDKTAADAALARAKAGETNAKVTAGQPEADAVATAVGADKAAAETGKVAAETKAVERGDVDGGGGGNGDAGGGDAAE